MGEYWSSSDFAYMCLLDERRTLALQEAIRDTIRPGDRVLDVGAGSGVLSLFAAAAGAASVTSVEVDTRLAEWIRQTAAANGFADRISVLEGNVLGHDLPAMDVVIAELVETALIEETLVPVLNGLRQRGVITAATRVIPRGYRTSMHLVEIDEQMYGFRFVTMRHEWPFYATDPDWHPVPAQARSPAVVVWESTLDGVGEVAEVVERRLSFAAGGAVNGVRITGEAELTGGRWLGACNTLNGDKVYPLPLRQVSGEAELMVRYRMGAGLRQLSVQWA